MKDSTKKKFYFLITLNILLLIFLFWQNFKRRPATAAQRSLSAASTRRAAALQSKGGESIALIDSDGNINSIGFPSGMIMIWYPANEKLTTLNLIENIPVGWAICDGNNGTPDLRGRFVLMAQDAPIPGVPGSSSHQIRQIGGEETHVLTEAEMPAHIHEIELHISGSGGSERVAREYGEGRQGTTYTGMRGGSQPHNNMPPFYTLVYVMKL